MKCKLYLPALDIVFLVASIWKNVGITKLKKGLYMITFACFENQFHCISLY